LVLKKYYRLQWAIMSARQYARTVARGLKKPDMSTKGPHLATSVILAAGAAIGANTINAIAPVDLLDISHFSQPQLSSAFAQDIDEQINIRVYKLASPAVVTINSGNATGSGSIISKDGLVLTNAHVVQNAGSTVTVILSDGRRMPSDIIAFGNNGLDLAVLKIRGQNNLPSIRFARSGSIQVGQRAFAIGNPFGQFQGTFTNGIVSRIDKQRGLIQTNAAINPGNSGGPLLNSQGELIGVNTAIFTSSRAGGNIGIGFAISIDRVQPFLTAVRQGTAPRTAQRQQSIAGSQRPQQLPLDGTAINGTLGRGDTVLPVDNSFFDLYSFQGRAGSRVQIDMVSQDFDPYLVLIGPRGNEVAQDNDSGGNKNARLVGRLPATGTYLVIANSHDPGQSGTYRIRAITADATGGNQQVQQGFILRQEGILGADAPTLANGSRYRVYSFQGSAGQTVTITAVSPDFDPYLILVAPNGQKIAENDDISQNNPNSGLRGTINRAGVYRVIVTASNRGGQGRYLLTIR
jgi:S1-C subfamily serine protease